jgi:hypothetical protein
LGRTNAEENPWTSSNRFRRPSSISLREWCLELSRWSNILAGTFFSATVASVAQQRGYVPVVGLALSGAVMARRAWDVKKTFCLSVQNVYRAARDGSEISNRVQPDRPLQSTSGSEDIAASTNRERLSRLSGGR